MSYTIRQFDEGKYIEYFYEGELTLAELERSRRKGNEILALKGWYRALVDVTTVHTYPATVDYFDFVSKLSDFPEKYIRVAIVVKEERKEIGRFVENVAVNRGLNVRCFTSREDGLRWLLSPGDPAGD